MPGLGQTQQPNPFIYGIGSGQMTTLALGQMLGTDDPDLLRGFINGISQRYALENFDSELLRNLNAQDALSAYDAATGEYVKMDPMQAQRIAQGWDVHDDVQQQLTKEMVYGGVVGTNIGLWRSLIDMPVGFHELFFGEDDAGTFMRWLYEQRAASAPTLEAEGITGAKAGFIMGNIATLGFAELRAAQGITRLGKIIPATNRILKTGKFLLGGGGGLSQRLAVAGMTGTMEALFQPSTMPSPTGMFGEQGEPGWSRSKLFALGAVGGLIGGVPQANQLAKQQRLLQDALTTLTDAKTLGGRNAAREIRVFYDDLTDYALRLARISNKPEVADAARRISETLGEEGKQFSAALVSDDLVSNFAKIVGGAGGMRIRQSAAVKRATQEIDSVVGKLNDLLTLKDTPEAATMLLKAKVAKELLVNGGRRSSDIGEKLFRSTRAYVREHFTDDFIPLIEFDERKLVGAPAHVKLMVDDGMKMLDEAAERIKADAGENVLEEAKLFLRSAVGGSASDAYAAYMRAHELVGRATGNPMRVDLSAIDEPLVRTAAGLLEFLKRTSQKAGTDAVVQQPIAILRTQIEALAYMAKQGSLDAAEELAKILDMFAGAARGKNLNLKLLAGEVSARDINMMHGIMADDKLVFHSPVFRSAGDLANASSVGTIISTLEDAIDGIALNKNQQKLLDALYKRLGTDSPAAALEQMQGYVRGSVTRLQSELADNSLRWKAGLAEHKAQLAVAAEEKRVAAETAKAEKAAKRAAKGKPPKGAGGDKFSYIDKQGNPYDAADTVMKAELGEATTDYVEFRMFLAKMKKADVPQTEAALRKMIEEFRASRVKKPGVVKGAVNKVKENIKGKVKAEVAALNTPEGTP
jgi:hypothetical protein